ncbi:uncharacterized protein EDB91DRAFT_1349374 [Suillus paluster]|uniref:uncharacterized protein n=1 Tax=Suillus paluster TaxID=48578 RepID=UPI001B8792DA|nr:uncharacterized protein EDB91DRAFT_1349374 [Suillus paluster]KAG1731322.1 hypothetical protein EDB91DRAFT_1349374 [Suillus paluster]
MKTLPITPVAALLNAQTVIDLNPSSYRGYRLKHAALHGAERYDEAIATFEIMLSSLDNDPDTQIRNLRQHYLSTSEAEDAIRMAIDAQLDNAPLRLFDTTTGLLCDQGEQISIFKTSAEYKKLLSSPMKHLPFRMELIQEVVVTYFGCVMLSHRWEGKEPLLHDIQDRVIYELNPIGGILKLQSFCKISREAGYRWAWSDTCCIDKNNNVELQQSLNSMFAWYRYSALTIVYLADITLSSKSGALATSEWNRRGWTVGEFLAPKVVLFYQKDWSRYLNDRSPNHKESVVIMQELGRATGIDQQALVSFSPGMSHPREKLQWASTRVTTLQEDIAYSLFGIFGINLPVIYGEKKHNALRRLLQEIIAQSGDITALDWVGKSSLFNTCLPADIIPPEDEMQKSISFLRDAVTVQLASEFYTLLDKPSLPRFANRRLHLPCIAFNITAVRWRRDLGKETSFTYAIKADGLHDLLITTEDKPNQFSRAMDTRQTLLLVRPWSRYFLELPHSADDMQSVANWSAVGSSVYKLPRGSRSRSS